MGKSSPQILRIRWEDPNTALITPIYSHVNVGSSLAPGTDDTPLAEFLPELYKQKTGK